MTIEAMLIAGFGVGFLVGILVRQQKLGCTLLTGVPIAMIVYIAWWQAQNSDALRSTSGLDFIFGPLWPSLGALAGFYLGRFVRSKIDKAP